jgi:hypothetical protein
MSTVKVNTVDKRTGGTLTLGGCGTTVTLGAGATQSGFGRTGTVDWCTTAKTAPFTGVSGNGYFVNTTSGVVTVTLPATPSAGDIISIADYASTFQTNSVIIGRNSSKINGICNNATLSTEGQSITLVYVDGTRGWKSTMDSTSDVSGSPAYIIATGGTITCCGDYRIHTFTADGCFSVSAAGNPAGSDSVDYIVVGGGGAGGGCYGTGSAGGGGGAGGFREGYNPGSYTASPLATTALPVTATTYPITIGAGGAGSAVPSPEYSGNPGSDSIFSTITSTGGGGGGTGYQATFSDGKPGGSGGGAGSYTSMTAGTGNTPPVSPPQGNSGGIGYVVGSDYNGGGGGGSTAIGGNGGAPSGGPGGAGATSSINGTPTTRGGGGGGGSATPSSAGTGGSGGGGGGGQATPSSGVVGNAGTANTGGGGGGSVHKNPPGAALTGGAGGSGIVIIRYKFQN